MVRFITLFFLIISIAFSANVGDIVSNSAKVFYQVADLKKALTSNRVDLKVASTPAVIEYYSYSPDSNISLNVEETKYKRDNNFTLMQNPTLPGGKSFNIPTKIPLKKSDSFLTEDLVIIRVVDLDRNIDASKQDTIKIIIKNPNNKDIEELILKESGNSSGEFVGYIHTSANSAKENDGIIEVNSGDNFIAYYRDYEGQNQIREVELKAVANVVESSALFVTKEASKSKASIGDFIKFKIKVTNNTNVKQKDITFVDDLPLGLKYKSGSFKVDGTKETPIYNGNSLRFKIKSLDENRVVEITYIAQVTPIVNREEIVNIAYANSLQAGKSNIARAVIKIESDFFNQKGYLLGEVYYIDKNGTKRGAPNVRLYLEDGRYSITDKDGRYHFIDLDNGTHVVGVDTDSIKNRFKLIKCNQDNRFANSLKSAFVDIKNGQMQRVDFCLKKLEKNFAHPKLETKLVKIDNKRVKLIFNLYANGLSNKEVYIKLPKGLKVVDSKEAKKVDGIWILPLNNSASIDLELKDSYIDDDIEAIFYYDTKREQDKESPKISLGLIKRDGNLHIVDSKKIIALDGVLKDSKDVDYSWVKPTKQESMPKYSKEEIDSFKESAKFVWPPKGWVPSLPSTRVAILIPKGGSVTLKLNGHKVDMVHYQGIFRGSNKNIIHFKGIDLVDGLNHFEAIVKKGKKVIARLSRDIYLESHAPASIEVLPKYSYLYADGIHSPIIAVRLRGKSGHLLRGGLVGAYDVNSPYEPLVKSNGKGRYEVDSKGIAYIKLKPTYHSGKVVLNINGLKVKTKLKAKDREWIIIGFGEATFGYETISKHLKKGNSGFYKSGQLALFARGTIKGKWLLTIAYNNKKAKRELFDRVDPNRYYTVYEDNSKSGNSAMSAKKFYIKLEKDDFYALFGDFKTGFNDTKLSIYNHAYSGFKSEYRYKNFLIKSFIAKSDKTNIREEIAPNGTKGYYYLKYKDIVVGSEEIAIETRDKDRDTIVIEKKELKPNVDYVIDYDLGRVYFSNPIYKHDLKGNPQYIVIKYQTKGANRYIYGARGVWENNKTKIGATYIKEQDSFKLIGADLNIKINDKIKATFEIAKTTKEDFNKTSSVAKLAQIEYRDKNISAKAYYKSVKSSFASSDIAKNSDYGVEIDKRLSKNYSISFMAHHQKVGKNSNSEAKTQLRYSDKNISASFGYKYSKSSGDKAKHQLDIELSKKINKRLSINFEHTQTFNFKDMTTSIGASYNRDKNSSYSLYLQRVKSRDKISYEIRTQAIYKPWRDATFKTSRVYRTSKDSTYLYDSYSLEQAFNFNKNTKATFGIEYDRSKNIKDRDYIALNGSVKYRDKNITSYLDIGYKVGSGDKSLNIDSGIYIQKSKELGLSFGIDYHKSWHNDEIIREINGKLSFVYRPLHGNLIILDRFDLKDKLEIDSASKLRETKFINNMHINYLASTKSRYGLQFGLKYAVDTFDNDEYKSLTAMLGLNGEWDIKDDLTFGIRGAILYGFNSNSMQDSLGIYAVKTLNKNMQIIAGYNFKGFRDEDFSNLNYHRQGLYLKFRIKFDGDYIKPWLDKVSK